MEQIENNFHDVALNPAILLITLNVNGLNNTITSPKTYPIIRLDKKANPTICFL